MNHINRTTSIFTDQKLATASPRNSEVIIGMLHVWYLIVLYNACLLKINKIDMVPSLISTIITVY